jgi:hypothetical protein
VAGRSSAEARSDIVGLGFVRSSTIAMPCDAALGLNKVRGGASTAAPRTGTAGAAI